MPSAPEWLNRRLLAVEAFVLRWGPLLALLAVVLCGAILISVGVVSIVWDYLDDSAPPCHDVALPTVRTESVSCGPYSTLGKVDNQLMCTCIHGPHP